MSDGSTFYTCVAGTTLVPINGIVVTIPCHGAMHRVCWMHNGPSRLLDHPDRHTRWLEKQLAWAAGDLDARRWRWCTEQPLHGCLAFLAGLADVLDGGSGIMPEWIYRDSELKRAFEEIVNVARAKSDVRRQERVARDGHASGHVETRRVDGGIMVISRGPTIRTPKRSS